MPNKMNVTATAMAKLPKNRNSTGKQIMKAISQAIQFSSTSTTGI